MRIVVVGVVLALSIGFIGYYVYDYFYIPDIPKGEKLTEYVGISPDGSPRTLSALRGKFVLVHFWASWCAACRKENPQWVALYDAFHGNGFEIFSISLDLDRSQWLRAIERDGLRWPNHISDLQGWNSQAALQFGVRSIPANFLLDRQGTVVAKNITAEQLRALLEQQPIQGM